MSLILAPSILAADFLHLDDELASLHTSWLHLDLMDGHFVPNLSFGMPLIKAITQKYSAFKLDAHLMVTNPAFYLSALKDCSIYNWTLHYEALAGITYQDADYAAQLAQPIRVNTTAPQIIALLKEAKKIYPSVGISLKPFTPLAVLTPEILSLVDLVLLMSVEPGFAGQKFIPEVVPRLQALAQLRTQQGLKFQIQIDGGVNLTTITQLTAADNLVVGAALFKNPPYPSTLAQLQGAYATTHS
ncbi:MAG: ribulose-phosphate 3-epimerase [Bacteriovoracaceae bacterium]|nr:ribulose-phosphate 3-epimerase [Bacteriovoracaceae bacterium]